MPRDQTKMNNTKNDKKDKKNDTKNDTKNDRKAKKSDDRRRKQIEDVPI